MAGRSLLIAVSVLQCLHTLLCAAEGARQNAFINYREVTSGSRTSDVWNPNDVHAVALVSSYGQIRLRLHPEWAPKACEAVARMAAGSLQACPGCSFYRHEPAPENWGANGFYGPPYGLLQGGLPGMTTKVELENPGQRAVMRGAAAFIAGSTDFFIGTVDHTEWGAAFTVFADVMPEDMVNVVPLVPVAPYRNSTDSQYHFTTRWLLEPVLFKLQPLASEDLAASDAASEERGGETL